jgi:hypothetical protein
LNNYREVVLLPLYRRGLGEAGKIKIPRFVGGTFYAVGFGYFMIEQK